MNRKLTFLVALFFCSISQSLAQQTLSVSAMLSPTFSHTLYNYRYFYPESDGQIVEPVYISGSRWSTGYSIGASVHYTYAPGWSVSSGIWFQQLSLRQARQAVAGEGTVSLRNRVIRFPLLLNYYSSTQRLSPYFSVGLFVDLPITSRVVVMRTGESTQYLRLLSTPRPIFHGMLGAGIRYKLTSRYTLIAQPTWTYKFGQLGGASVNDSSVEFSLQTQVGYTF
ncbi:PorT family protein [Spirosoma sp. KCTC 42546]|uniref:outer membrane beta-barrel protein n=1 Tax=Spirosoma sp. KCTC 42546 TaxID=2520506 RepID=UPI001159F35E|nr:outer membrane beta-barrel protein [Spirosoma sp. KCTC 42546]QDK79276.1 PorT family protein [Spirosoma sp. KCTC 42546]